MLINAVIEEVYKRTMDGQMSSINLLAMKDKEPFYEKCGFEKVPLGYVGYGMIKRINKNE